MHHYQGHQVINKFSYDEDDEYIFCLGYQILLKIKKKKFRSVKKDKVIAEKNDYKIEEKHTYIIIETFICMFITTYIFNG